MKKFLGTIVSMLMAVFFLVGCSNAHQPKVAETPITVIMVDKGILCSNDTMITYRTHRVQDTFLCDKDGLTVSGSQNLKMLVTVSNFSPVKGEAVTVTYSFKKDESTQLDNCEISPNNGLHERVQDGRFTITATGNTTFYQLRCINGDSTVEAEFTLRAPAFGG